jgi:uroporphyrinogen-III synthase
MSLPTFDGLRVLSLESRRASELATLIKTFGGRPLAAPALREVPLDSNRAAADFAAALERGEFDIVIFLTGVGVRALLEAIQPEYSRERLASALARAKAVVRGPKPLAVLRELDVPVWVTAPEPNTWHEVITAMEARAHERPLAAARIAVQEYGVSNPELLGALRARGAQVTAVPVYRWELPDDLGPIQRAIRAIARGAVDVAIFTSGVQVAHLWKVAQRMGLQQHVQQHLERSVIASIGPTTSGELARADIPRDIEASHPKIGILVREAAERSADLLRAKRRQDAVLSRTVGRAVD